MSQRAPADIEVRSSTQSTAVTPSPASLSFDVAGPSPFSLGPLGLGRSGRGSGGVSLAMGLRSWELARRGTRGIEVLADAVQRLAGVARREALQLGVDAEARPDLDVAVAHARVEAVQRADRRAAGALALEVVDAAVAGTDEARRGLDVADRAAEMHAARRDRDVVAVLILGHAVAVLVVLAH